MPVRMCIICRKHSEKENFYRFVKDKNSGIVVLDSKMNAQSRGVYVCKSPSCISALKNKSGVLSSMLSAKLALDFLDEL